MSEVNAEEVAEIGKWFFRKYVDEAQIPQDQVRYADITNFLQWMGRTAVSSFEVAGKLNCGMPSVEFFMGLPHSPTGPNQLIAMWPYLTLSHRTQEHALRSMQILMVLTWDDGVTVPHSIFAHKDTTDGDLNDAAVCHLVMTRTQGLSDKIVETALDEMHDDHVANQTRQAYKTVQLIAECLKTTQQKLDAEEVSRINDLLLFMASMFPETVPKELQARLRANVDADGMSTDAPTPSNLEELSGRGGWDDPDKAS